MRALAGGLAVAALGGCTLPYYWQAAAGHLGLVRKRIPIEAVLADPAQPEPVKDRLRRVLEMRRFAVEALDLPDNDSYRSYVDLGRPYVVWNVVAADEFSVQPEQWCFSLLGCVSYRGYFAREQAEAFAATLRAKGMDTYVAGATAYSTLGYFADPVLNTMLAGGEPYIAGVLFHELAHQKFYVKGDSDLNESFATAVQQYGTELWLLERGALADVEAFRRRLARQADFTALVAVQRERLERIYASGSPPDVMRAEKRAAFARMREEYAHYRRDWGGVSEYDQWFAEPLNNAKLAAVATYRHWLPGLLWFLERNGLEALYARIAEFETLPEADRERRLEALLEAATRRSPAVEPDYATSSG